LSGKNKKWLSSGMLRRVVKFTGVSEVLTASIIRAMRTDVFMMLLFIYFEFPQPRSRIPI
jgi:hypothetical protein